MRKSPTTQKSNVLRIVHFYKVTPKNAMSVYSISCYKSRGGLKTLLWNSNVILTLLQTRSLSQNAAPHATCTRNGCSPESAIQRLQWSLGLIQKPFWRSNGRKLGIKVKKTSWGRALSSRDWRQRFKIQTIKHNSNKVLPSWSSPNSTVTAMQS